MSHQDTDKSLSLNTYEYTDETNTDEAAKEAINGKIDREN